MPTKAHTQHGNVTANQAKHPFVLPSLPYERTALEPHMSSRTFDFHYDKHHAAYVQNLNRLLEDNDLRFSTLEDVIMQTAFEKDKTSIFNNAAQIWNHTFFWHSLAPNGGGKPQGMLLDRIILNFGSFDMFVEEFKNAGLTQFGSGWVWLVYDVRQEMLRVVKTANAEVPFTKELVALITCDVWEHAYYIDFQNRRGDFLTVFLSHLVNWDFALKNLLNAVKR
jgi:Fe-Mn family superoxide dismutase